MSELKPVRGWAIASPHGILVSSVKRTRTWCIESWLRGCGTPPWKAQGEWRRRKRLHGQRCIEVTVIPRSEDDDE